MVMAKLTDNIIYFFKRQHFVIASTIDKNKRLHSSCKGIVEINKSGKIYLFDLYRGTTFNNLKINPSISITAVDEHKFKGYCLKGKAEIIKKSELKGHLVKSWEDKIASRVTKRLIKNIQGEKGHQKHPEILMPSPEYMIIMKVERIVDLIPHHLK